jgi:hypothetical protein
MRIGYDEAMARSRHAHSKWPARGEGNRLEPEAWPVLSPRFRLRPGETVFTIGSCFARNIEGHLAQLGFRVPAAEYRVPVEECPRGFVSGILNKYTPHSMRDELDWAARVLRDGPSDALLSESLFELDGGQCIDLNLASYIPVTLDRGVQRRAEIAELYRHCFEAEVVIMTLGLIEAWYDTERGAYIQQIPNAAMTRRTPERWQFEILSYADSLQAIREAIGLLGRTGRAGKKIILTTSPVPIGRSFSGEDPLLANTYSKSVLRAVCGTLAGECANVDYAPAYESATLSKSPEVWMDDLIHVRTSFVGKIVERILAAYVDDQAALPQLALEERMARMKAIQNTAVHLSAPRPAREGVRYRELQKGVVIFAPDAQPHALCYGPLDLSRGGTLTARLQVLEGTSVLVRIEVHDPDSEAAGFEWELAMGERLVPLRLSLPALSKAATLTWTVSADTAAREDRRVARLRIENPRIMSPPPPPPPPEAL